MKKKKNEQIKTVIISYDEKPGIQAIGNTYPDLMPVEGHYSSIARDYEYKRHGTLSLLAGIDLISGGIYYKVFEQHRSCEFVEYLKGLESTYLEEKIIHQKKLGNTWRRFLINLNLFSHPNMLRG